MMHRLYVMAHLGNPPVEQMLFPWARAEILRQQLSVPMLAPQWRGAGIPGWRSGKWGRGGTAPFSNRSYLSGVARLRVLLTARRCNERSFVPGAEDTGGHGRKTLVVFAGKGDGFSPLLAHRELVRQRLTDILAPHVHRQLSHQSHPFVIGVHVQRSAADGGPAATASDPPTPWFVRCIQSLRKVLGFAAPVQLFSEASPERLRTLLAMPNVTLAEERSGVPGLLRLSRSRILIGGAGSAFSQWAAFLGEMPSLWHAGAAPHWPSAIPHFASEAHGHGQVPEGFAEVIESLGLALNP